MPPRARPTLMTLVAAMPRTRLTENGVALWGGYVFSGDLVVYAADLERGVVQDMLESARPVTE